MDNETIKINTETIDRRQNLASINHVSAAHSGRVDAVLDALRRCEAHSLTPEEVDMTLDIVQSINEHGEQSRAVAAYYLVRYGMLIAREDRAG